MDPNRLHINIGGGQGGTAGGFNNDRVFSPSNERVFPTTPSTYPQPIFQRQPGEQYNEYAGAQIQSPVGAQGYFQNNQQFQPQRGQQPPVQYSNQYQQQGLQSSQPGYRPGFATNDPNASLARQFSNQNLGSSQRQASPYGRLPSPAQGRPRTGGAPGQQSQPGHLGIPLSGNMAGSQSSLLDEPPEPNMEKYSNNIVKKISGLHVFIQEFFKENVERAKTRNERAAKLRDYKKSPNHSDKDKKKEEGRVWLAETAYLRQLRTLETPQDYQTIKIIGKGAFGEVKLVTHRSTGKIYALKCLVKAEMLKKDQLAHVRAERDVLAEADSDWVVKLYRSFQDTTFLYMLMEYLPGGDLMTSLIKYEVFSEDVTRFYMAEILLAIEAIHKLGFIHRDIKPDNILMDANGHIKLTDFGLSTGFHQKHEASYYQQLLSGISAKPRNNRYSVSLDQINLTVSNRSQVNSWRQSRRRMAYSTVGTPDYIAPEIFSGKGYTFSCDWWSLGAIMFECMIGWPPFCAEEATETYRKIVDWQYTLQFPEDIRLSPAPEDLIRSLLCDAPNRLGHTGNSHGADEIKQHPFFHNVQWDQLRNIHAPFKPQLANALDVSYFPIQDIDQNDHSAHWRAQTEVLAREHGAEMSLPFIGYTFRRFDGQKS